MTPSHENKSCAHGKRRDIVALTPRLSCRLIGAWHNMLTPFDVVGSFWLPPTAAPIGERSGKNRNHVEFFSCDKILPWIHANPNLCVFLSSYLCVVFAGFLFFCLHLSSMCFCCFFLLYSCSFGRSFVRSSVHLFIRLFTFDANACACMRMHPHA